MVFGPVQTAGADALQHATKVGGEIPANLHAAAAEIPSWVWRANRCRYYAESNQQKSAFSLLGADG
jgi:hypothetical protein